MTEQIAIPIAVDSDAVAHDKRGDELDLAFILLPLRRASKSLAAMFIGCAILGAAGSYLIPPVFSASTTFIPPQQQTSANAALSSLGALANLAGGGATIKSPAGEYLAFMQSVTVSDRIVDRFGLMKRYEARYRVSARTILAKNVRMNIGQKDGLITVEVDDTDPARAAAIANQYVEELRRMTSMLAVTEAQQRRVFFERQMQDAKAHLATAQSVLQQSGFSGDAIKTEPAAAAEQYARLRANEAAAEVRVQTLRSTLSDSAPEVRQQLAQLAALREQVARLAATTSADAGQAPDYVNKYREFKYQETLFDLMSKQYELARVDESHEGQLVQVVDPATPPELKSKPKRAYLALGAGALGVLLLSIALIWRAARVPRQH